MIRDEMDEWGKEEWELYRKLILRGEGGKKWMSQEAVREVSKRRREKR